MTVDKIEELKESNTKLETEISECSREGVSLDNTSSGEGSASDVSNQLQEKLQMLVLENVLLKQQIKDWILTQASRSEVTPEPPAQDTDVCLADSTSHETSCDTEDVSHDPVQLPADAEMAGEDDSRDINATSNTSDSATRLPSSVVCERTSVVVDSSRSQHHLHSQGHTHQSQGPPTSHPRPPTSHQYPHTPISHPPTSQGHSHAHQSWPVSSLLSGLDNMSEDSVNISTSQPRVQSSASREATSNRTAFGHTSSHSHSASHGHIFSRSHTSSLSHSHASSRDHTYSHSHTLQSHTSHDHTYSHGHVSSRPPPSHAVGSDTSVPFNGACLTAPSGPDREFPSPHPIVQPWVQRGHQHHTHRQYDGPGGVAPPCDQHWTTSHPYVRPHPPVLPQPESHYQNYVVPHPLPQENFSMHGCPCHPTPSNCCHCVSTQQGRSYPGPHVRSYPHVKSYPPPVTPHVRSYPQARSYHHHSQARHFPGFQHEHPLPYIHDDHGTSCDSMTTPPYQHLPHPVPAHSSTVWRPYSETNRSTGFYLSDILAEPEPAEHSALQLGPAPPPSSCSSRLASFLMDRLLDDIG